MQVLTCVEDFAETFTDINQWCASIRSVHSIISREDALDHIREGGSVYLPQNNQVNQ